MLYKIKFLKTNKEYEIYPQFKINDKFSAELDMYEFTLKPIEEEIDFDFAKYNGLIPMILIAGGTDFKLMYLSYYKQTTIAYTPVRKFKYVIQATSLTFAFQRITLPNKLITQPLNDDKRTVWEELNKLLEVYAPEFELDRDLEQLLSIPTPELQFTKSTLYEVLVAMFAVAGLAPKQSYLNVIGYIDLKSSRASNNWESKDLFIRYEKHNSLTNYTDALDYDLENIIGSHSEITTTWLAPTSEEAMITDDNFIWVLPNDIYEITDARAIASGTIITPTSSGNEISEFKNEVINLTNYIVPKTIWETLKVSSLATTLKGEYKRNYIYYEGNKIVGNFLETTWLGSTVQIDRAIKNALQFSMQGTIQTLPDRENTSVSITTSYRNILLQVTYKPVKKSSRVKVVKNDVIIPNNSLIANQEDSYIDIDNFGKQKKELINRMGNEIIIGQANFSLYKKILSEIPIAELGDYVDGNYIISEREMQFNENSVMINYTLAKDYIFLTSYSGVNQLKRFTSIDTTNCLIRNDLILKNIQLSVVDAQKNTQLTNFLTKSYGKGVKTGYYHLVKTYDANDEELFENYALLASQNTLIGDSVVCQIGFETNAKVGDSIVYEDTAYLKEPLKYVDNNGEFKTLHIWFNGGQQYEDEIELAITRKYPRVAPNKLPEDIFEDDILVYKDNREVTSIAYQFRFIGDNKQVLVYNNFAKYVGLIPHTSAKYKIYRKQCSVEEFEAIKYTTATITPIGSLADESVTLDLIEKDGHSYFEILNVCEQIGYWLIGVADESGNLLFALNYENTDGIKSICLYFNEI